MTPQEAIDILSTLAGYENTMALILDYSVTVQDALHMAVKALEQQPCEDCISREEAIRIAEQGQIQGYEWQFKKLCTLPSVTPKGVTITDFADKCQECGKIQNELLKNKWIPVSERLPKEAGVYLVSMNRLGYPQREVDGFVCGRWERFGNDVIAWCEIPQPYKAESEE